MHTLLAFPGYKRNIPSWPRYSMQGDPRLGTHDLVITNVTHEDAGTYECQVSPVAGQSPLRRQTTLSILGNFFVYIIFFTHCSFLLPTGGGFRQLNSQYLFLSLG